MSRSTYSSIEKIRAKLAWSIKRQILLAAATSDAAKKGVTSPERVLALS